MNPIVLDGKIYFNFSWKRNRKLITFMLADGEVLPRFESLDICEDGQYYIAGKIKSTHAGGFAEKLNLEFEIAPDTAFGNSGIKVLRLLHVYKWELSELGILTLRDYLEDKSYWNDYEIVQKYIDEHITESEEWGQPSLSGDSGSDGGSDSPEDYFPTE